LGTTEINHYLAALSAKCGGEAWILTAVGDDELGKEAVCEA